MNRIRDLVAYCAKHDVPVRMVTADDPSEIVFSDGFQVVGETGRWAK